MSSPTATLRRLRPWAARSEPASSAGVVAAALALSALSLLVVGVAPAYDPWAWLVWGRESLSLDLDTSGGPSFKPLPVMATTVLALTGDAAPALWLVVGRAGALVALVLAFVLARRLGGGGAAGVIAGVVAVVALLLTPADDARFLRHAAQGLSEPLLVALVLGAVHRQLAGCRGQALALGLAAGLVRPEAWLLVLTYVAWAWRARAIRREVLVVAVAALPLLWLGGDLLGSGSATTGADRARQPDVASAKALEHALGAAILPVLIGGLLVAAAAARRAMGPGTLAPRAGAKVRDPGDLVVVVLAAGGIVWSAEVWGMAAFLDYAADPRFFEPAAAAWCVLAGVGAGRAWGFAQRLRGPRTATWLAVGALAVTVPFAYGRVEAIIEHPDTVQMRADVQSDLADALREAGHERVRGCAPLSVDGDDDALEAPVRAAWELDVPLAQIDRWLADRGTAVVRRDRRRAASYARSRAAVRVARAGGWDVYLLRCR